MTSIYNSRDLILNRCVSIIMQLMSFNHGKLLG